MKQEVKDKISSSKKGKPCSSPETAFKKGFSPWNKGVKTKIVPKTAFKKGVPSWNKGTTGKMNVLKGDKSHFWKGGISTENNKIRNSMEMRLWRKSCMERDFFTCAKTGQKGGKLIVHHINNFADFPELRTSIENGITLTVEAHKEFHSIYGKKNNTREQLVEFLNPSAQEI